MNVKFIAVVTRGEDGITIAALAPELDLDRPQVAAWGIGHGKEELANRLARAIEAGVATPAVEIKEDVNGKTYLSTETVIIGRRMSADLQRLGY